MSNNLATLLAPVANRVLRWAAQDDEFGLLLRGLAEAIVCHTAVDRRADQGSPTDLPVSAGSQEAQQVNYELSVATGVCEASPTEAVALEAEPTTETRLPTRRRLPRAIPATDDDLPVIERRCRLKAEAAAWCIERSRLLDEGASFREEVLPVDQSFFQRGRESGCFIWLPHPSTALRHSADDFRCLADCYEALAAGTALLIDLLPGRGIDAQDFEAAMRLTAEAQSGLRVTLDTCDGPLDPDQGRVFFWLRSTAQARRIYLPRFLRLNDLADPGSVEDLQRRFDALRASVDERRERERRQSKRLDCFRHHVRAIRNGSVDGHWQRLATVLDELIADGMPPSNVEVRDSLKAILSSLPSDLESRHGIDLIVRELDRLRPRRIQQAGTSRYREPVTDRSEVERLLRGRELVLVGGLRRPETEAALIRAFSLKKVTWVEVCCNWSQAEIETYISRPDVAVVIVVTRWARHCWTALKPVCDRHGKPLMRLRGGMNPSNIAWQIKAQCSDRLKGIMNVSRAS